MQMLEPEPPSEAAMRREREALDLVVAAKAALDPEKVGLSFSLPLSLILYWISNRGLLSWPVVGWLSW